ncbi:MAG: hypothetical protein ACI4TT_02100, partial [Christensenellales bacterium]
KIKKLDKNGFGIVDVKVGLKTQHTIANSKTGKAFENIIDVLGEKNGFYKVQLKDKSYAYFDPAKDQMIDNIAFINTLESDNSVFERVKLKDGSWTYFNTEKGELSNKHFKNLTGVSNGFAAVQLENGEWTLFNANKNLMSKRRYKNAEYIGKGCYEFNVFGKSAYKHFDANEGKFSGDLFYEKSDLSINIVDMLQKSPEEFANLPTSVFEKGNKQLLEQYIDITKSATKAKAAELGETQEAQDYIDRISKIVKDKINNERDAIALREQEKGKAPKELENASDVLTKEDLFIIYGINTDELSPEELHNILGIDVKALSPQELEDTYGITVEELSPEAKKELLGANNEEKAPENSAETPKTPNDETFEEVLEPKQEETQPEVVEDKDTEIFRPIQLKNGMWSYFDATKDKVLDLKHLTYVSSIDENGLGLVKIKKGFKEQSSIFNSKTGKVDNRIINVVNSDNNFYAVQLKNKSFAYYNVKNGELVGNFKNIDNALHSDSTFNRVQLKDGSWTYFNTKTGEPFKQSFMNVDPQIRDGYASVQLKDGYWSIINTETQKEVFSNSNYQDCLPIKDGLALQKDDGTWVHFDTKTGKLLNEHFVDPRFTDQHYSELIPIQLKDDSWTYYEANTGKLLLDNKFKNIYSRHGFGIVQLEDDSLTYFDEKNGKTSSQRFDAKDRLFEVYNDFARVQTSDGSWAFYDAKNDKVSNKLENVIEPFNVHNGFARVRLNDGNWSYYDAKTDSLLNYRVDESKLGKNYNEYVNKFPIELDFKEILKKSPEDFTHLPTDVFKKGNKELLDEYRIIAEKALTEKYAKLGETQEAKDYVKNVLKMMDEKTIKEKQSLGEIDLTKLSDETLQKEADDIFGFVKIDKTDKEINKIFDITTLDDNGTTKKEEKNDDMQKDANETAKEVGTLADEEAKENKDEKDKDKDETNEKDKDESSSLQYDFDFSSGYVGTLYDEENKEDEDEEDGNFKYADWDNDYYVTRKDKNSKKTENKTKKDEDEMEL